MRYFKNLLSDLKSGRLALHPILLAVTFCIVKFSWPRLIGRYGETLGSFIFMDFIQCACFVGLGAHLIYVVRDATAKTAKVVAAKTANYEGAIRPRGLRYLAVLRAILCALCIIACVAGYLSADINHQKLGVLNWFFPTALASAFIYLIAIWIVTTGSEVLIWGIIFVISYVAAYYAVLMGFGVGHRYATYFNFSFIFWKGLEIIFPLIWAFYFKCTYKKRLAEEMREA